MRNALNLVPQHIEWVAVHDAARPLASADLCLYVLGLDQGQSYANDVSRVLISPPHRAGAQNGPMSRAVTSVDELRAIVGHPNAAVADKVSQLNVPLAQLRRMPPGPLQ